MARDVLEVARGELGNTESPAGSNRTKYGAWMKLDCQPWCMSFVQWCYAQAGKPLPFRTGSCSALLNWYKEHRPECIVTEPQPRDIIIYNFGHTGLVERPFGSTVTAIEGNTSAGDSGSQDNGGGVFRRTRRKSLVKAYIRPFKEEEMDQEKFNQMFKTALDSYRKDLRDNDASSYSQEARAWAIARGIIKGGGKLQDGTDNYMWEDLLTREQMVTLLYRWALIMGVA